MSTAVTGAGARGEQGQAGPERALHRRVLDQAAAPGGAGGRAAPAHGEVPPPVQTRRQAPPLGKQQPDGSPSSCLRCKNWPMVPTPIRLSTLRCSPFNPPDPARPEKRDTHNPLLCGHSWLYHLLCLLVPSRLPCIVPLLHRHAPLSPSRLASPCLSPSACLCRCCSSPACLSAHRVRTAWGCGTWGGTWGW